MIIDKLKKNNGETIAEVLIALLISSLGMVMLASTIVASSRMSKGSTKRQKETFNAANYLEETTSGKKESFKIELGSSQTNIDACVITNDKSPKLFKYELNNTQK